MEFAVMAVCLLLYLLGRRRPRTREQRNRERRARQRAITAAKGHTELRGTIRWWVEPKGTACRDEVRLKDGGGI